MTFSSFERQLKFITSDNREFVVKESIAIQFETIKHIIEEDCLKSVIPLPNVHSGVFGMVIQYCTKHAEEKISESELRKFDSEFVKKDYDALLELVLAANYLDIKSLLYLVCQEIADRIKDLMPEQVRKIFGIENDFSPEEEAATRKKHEWAYSDIRRKA